jgi:hypothetical protein
MKYSALASDNSITLVIARRWGRGANYTVLRFPSFHSSLRCNTYDTAHVEILFLYVLASLY